MTQAQENCKLSVSGRPLAALPLPREWIGTPLFLGPTDSPWPRTTSKPPSRVSTSRFVLNQRWWLAEIGLGNGGLLCQRTTNSSPAQLWWMSRLVEIFRARGMPWPSVPSSRLGTAYPRSSASPRARSQRALDVSPTWSSDVLRPNGGQRACPHHPSTADLRPAARCRYFLVTWNCKHLANANKFGHIRRVNGILGLHVPTLVTPLELLGENAS